MVLIKQLFDAVFLIWSPSYHFFHELLFCFIYECCFCLTPLMTLLFFLPFFRPKKEKKLQMGVAQNNVDMEEGTLEVAMGMLCTHLLCVLVGEESFSSQ